MTAVATMAVMELTEALTQAEEMRDKLSAERDRIVGELADLDIEIRGLRAAVHRFGGPVPLLSRIEDASAEDVFRTLPRTEAIEIVLRGAEVPMSPDEVRIELEHRGRTDNYNATSAAIAHLARKGRVHSEGRGQWVIGPKPRIVSQMDFMRDAHDADTAEGEALQDN